LPWGQFTTGHCSKFQDYRRWVEQIL
jgi:hypothetical protein